MLTFQGKEYARVSDILKPFSDFSNIPFEVLQRKQNIGTQVHAAIADDIANDFPCIGPDSVGYFDSFEKWKERLLPHFEMSEKRLYCPKKMISGQIDTLVQFDGQKGLLLVDFKTSAQESSITWPMQAHLYHYLLAENGYEVLPRFLFIKLDKNGETPKVYEYKYDPNIHAKCMDAVDFFWKMQLSDSH